MKSKLGIVLCFICALGLFEEGFAGNLDPEAAAGFPARVEKTGQTTTCGPRDDGRLRKGVPWPNPRFTDNGNGTVTDNLTGLIWLKDAHCSKFWAGDGYLQNRRTLGFALEAAKRLQDGYCGLTDGSKVGGWRLPNIKELQSLIHYGFANPSLPNTTGTGQWTEEEPFSNVQSSYYWSSTADAYSGGAWIVSLHAGNAETVGAAVPSLVWPVRGR